MGVGLYFRFMKQAEADEAQAMIERQSARASAASRSNSKVGERITSTAGGKGTANPLRRG